MQPNRRESTSPAVDSRVRKLPQRNAPEPTLWDLLRTLVQYRGTIVATLLGAIALAGIYAAVCPRRYESTALLQVEEERKSPVTNQGVEVAGETPSESEVEILRSRSLLGGVVDQLALDVVARPKWFPVVGGVLARLHKPPTLAPVPLGSAALAGFAWGGERIRVPRLEPSADLVDDKMILTALGEGRYRLVAEDGRPLVEGEVGTPAHGADGPRTVDLLVTELVARPGTRFTLVKLDRDEVIDSLLEDLRVQERSKSIERGKNNGLLALTLQGDDPATAAATLEAIVVADVQLNLARKMSEAKEMLTSLDQQLPVLRDNLTKAEAALNAYQRSKGPVSLAQGTDALLAESAAVEKQLGEIDVQEAELRQRFETDHPAIVALEGKAAKLRRQKVRLEQQLRELPTSELEALRLTRNVKVASDLYVQFMSRAEELRIAVSGLTGNVHAIDHASRPRRPAKPKPVLVMLLGTILGLAGGVAAAIVRRSFEAGAEDPDDIEAQTDLTVYVAVPHTDREDRATKRGEPRALLAEAAPQDPAIEHLRRLRAILEGNLPPVRGAGPADATRNGTVISVGGPCPETGKSFVSVNLAWLLASTGRTVLVIDCDLRRGGLHHYSTGIRALGLSEVVGGDVELERAVRNIGPNLSLLTTGKLPRSPTEFLATPKFRDVVAAAARRYDIVVLDTPPVLAVADAIHAAATASLNLLVLRAGRQSIRDIRDAVRHFAQGSVTIHGAVLNDVRTTLGRYARYARSYRYEAVDGAAAEAGSRKA